jgi:alpha-beta hydrolase superfamily lysophospholipase
MPRDPQVDLVFSHFTPRYIATGVDPNDLDRLKARIEHWDDWCRIWSDEAAKHAQFGEEALQFGRRTTASESFLHAAIYYHYAKHLFADRPDEYRAAHDHMLRCYTLAAPDMNPQAEHLTFPFDGAQLHGWLRCRKSPTESSTKSPSPLPVAVILPGLDACKEELHAWSEAFLARGLATLTLDGPGQGESAFALPIRTDWGHVIGAVIDGLRQRRDVDADRVGVVGQSLGAFYAPLAASQEPRIKACIANCGPYDWGRVLPKMPNVSQEVFRVRSGAATIEAGHEVANGMTLKGAAAHIRCPLLVVFGGGDRLIPPAEGERLAREAAGPSKFVLYPEGNHVCFNISYKFRPFTADWMAETLFGK